MKVVGTTEDNFFWPQPNDKTTDIRATVGLGILVLAFAAIACRLFYLQILQSANYREQVQENTTYILTQSAPRGIIYDREHRVLASNRQSPSIVILPSVVLNHDVEPISARLALILGSNQSEIKNKLLKLKKNDSRPYTLQTNLTLDQVAAIYENRFNLPGITVQQQSARYYVNGSVLSHVLGYTGQISPTELKKSSDRRLNDIVGKYGIEKLLDDQLRGENAYKRIKVNRHGQPVERVDLDEVASGKLRSGKDVTLTIDLDLQKLAEANMKNMRGAVVIIDVRSGEILALASKPSFDPNLFTAKISGNALQQINSSKAFLNRAMSAYPPGSIWKPLVLLAALESKAVKPTEKFAVSGAYYLGSFRFGDWTSKTGVFTLQKSLAWSRDTAFYQMGVRMKDKDITAWGKRLGAGEPTGIELPHESTGILPDEAWKAKNLKNGWFPGYTLNYSIGQGFLLLTPLQAARMMAGLATGDRLPKLHLVKQVGEQLPRRPNPEFFQTTPSSIKVVHEGLFECVESGTCQASKVPGLLIAGKTGSAEAPPNKKTHGWYAAYAPTDNPEIAIVVFAEAAGHGGTVAAPVAKGLIELYFTKYHRWAPKGSAVLAKNITVPQIPATQASADPNEPVTDSLDPSLIPSGPGSTLDEMDTD
jgi:penicillin-binding protein 2